MSIEQLGLIILAFVLGCWSRVVHGAFGEKDLSITAPWLEVSYVVTMVSLLLVLALGPGARVNLLVPFLVFMAGSYTTLWVEHQLAIRTAQGSKL